MATLLKQIDLESLFSFTQVSVVQSIDTAALKVLLSQLLTGQAAASDKINAQQQEIDALKAIQQEVKQQQNGAHRPQGSAAATASGLGVAASANREPAGAASVSSTLQDKETADSSMIQAHLLDLDNRVTQLEKQQHAASSPAMAAASAAGQRPEIADACASSSSSAVPPTSALAAEAPAVAGISTPWVPSAAAALTSQSISVTDHAAALADLRHQHALLANQLAAVQAALAAADAKSTLFARNSESNTEEVQLQALAEGLSAKADGRELELVRKQLAGKADRSELDALLNGLAAVSRADVPDGADSTGDSAEGLSGAAAGRAQIAKLQLQLAVLQERLTNKADIATVADVSDKLDAICHDSAQLHLTIQDLANQLGAAHKDIAGVQNVTHSLQQYIPTAPSIASQDITLQTQQLPLMLVRLSALEEALAANKANTGQNRAAALKHSTSTDGRSSLQFSNSMHTEAASNPYNSHSSSSAINDLVNDVARLQLQVKQLVQMVRSSNNHQRAAASTANSPGVQAPASASVATAINSSSAETHVTGPAMQDTAGSKGNAEVDFFTGAIAPDSTDRATVFSTESEAGSNTDSGFAKLAAQMAELQEQLEALAAAKADRGEVERLRGLLAETASQSDTELLRHKLDSQQSQVTRLAHQLSLTGACLTSVNNTSHGGSAAPLAAAQSESRNVQGLSRALADTEGFGEVSLNGAIVAAGGQVAHSGKAVQHAVLDGCEANQPLAELQDQLQQQRAGLEMLAQAVCLLATGQAAVTATVGNDTSAAGSSNMSSKGLVGDGAAGPAGLKALVSAGGAGMGYLTSTDGGANLQLTRLNRLLQTGHVGRKLDWFDPVLLQKMAQRLAAAEALIKMHPSSSQGPAGGDDVEGRLRRLAADVKMLKEQLGNAPAAGTATRQSGQGGWCIREGDHTMLASKPLAGYRCMACDRPLASLDSSPGPYLPTGGMPVSVSTGAELLAAAGTALGKLLPAGSRRNTVQDAVTAPADVCDKAGYSPAVSPDPLLGGVPARRVTGPLNWYTSAHGLPAEQLPKGNVGPHLPPGGWRGSLPRADDGSVLPALVSRGGAGAGTQGAAGGRS